MEPRKLKLLLIIGISAMVVAIICLLSMNSLIGTMNDYNDRQQRADAVLGTLTWADILAQGGEGRETASAEASESAAPSEEPSVSAEPEQSTPAEAENESSSPSEPAEEESASAQPTLPPAERPPVLVGGGLVPYDDRKFEITPGAVPQAGFAKVITITREGQIMRAQDISWEVDVPDSDDVHVTVNGVRLADKDPIGTGTLVQLYDGDEIIDTAVIVLPGDVTGTGEVDAAQVTVLQKEIAEPGTLTGAFLMAGDLDGSGSIDEADVAILRERVGVEE